MPKFEKGDQVRIEDGDNDHNGMVGIVQETESEGNETVYSLDIMPNNGGKVVSASESSLKPMK